MLVPVNPKTYLYIIIINNLTKIENININLKQQVA